MALVSPVSIDRALAAGQSVYRLALSNWGNVGTGLDPLSIQFRMAQSFAGIAIDPQSRVGRVRVAYNFLAGLSAVPQSGDEWLLTVRTPLLIPIYGPVILVAEAGTLFADTITVGTPGAPALFGKNPALPAGIFVDPVLRLMLFFSDVDASLAPNAGQTTGPIRLHSFVGAAEEEVYILPTSGRRRGRFLCTNLDANPTDLRVTGVYGGVETQSLATAAGLALNTGVLLTVSDPPDFLILRATHAAGAVVNALRIDPIVDD